MRNPLLRQQHYTFRITIKQDALGRYCLNDLHKASGGDPKNQPAHFFALDSTKALVEELKQSRDSEIDPVQAVRGGKTPGTYVVKELVYAYAMWISATFQLKVIRAFDTLQTQGVAVADHAAEDLLKNPLKQDDPQDSEDVLPEAYRLPSDGGSVEAR